MAVKVKVAVVGVPLMEVKEMRRAPDQGTAAGAVYTFVVWFALVLFAAILAQRLSEPLRETPPGADRDPEEL